MTGTILILIFFLIISLIATIVQEKYKTICRGISVISMFFLIISIIDLFTGYNPITFLREKQVSEKNNIQKEQSSNDIDLEKPSVPIEVLLPEHSESKKNTEEKSEMENKIRYIQKATIINIGQTVYRDDNNNISIIWTPITGQANYKIKIEVDDPFSDSESEKEFTCENNWIDIDVSQYSSDTVIFASVGVLDVENSEWVYCEPIHFTLY